MAKFYSKQMRVTEWAPFQDSFEEMFVALKAPNTMAMWAQGEPGSDRDRILLTSEAYELMSEQSPGGWEPLAKPQGGWVLLSGNASASEDHGVTTMRLGGADARTV